MDGYGTNRSTGQASNDQNNQRRNSELGENVLGQIWHWMMNSHQNSDYGDTERDLESAERAEREREREREREEQRKRVQELDARIAAENDESEKAMAKHKEEMQNKKATMVRQNTERRLKIKKENEKHQQFLQKQAQERAIKEEEAEKEHQQKLKENEEDPNAEKERFQELSQTRMAELEKQKKELEEEIQQMKVNQEQSSKEWEANLHIKLNNVQEEFLKEIANRKEQEEAQISNLKLINEESEQKSISLAKSLTELQTVVKEKKREMSETQRDSQAINSKQGNIQQDSVSNQPIKLVENQMLGTIDVIIENTNDSKNIAVIGLPKTGRSTLVGALAGGIWPKNLSQNPVNTKYGKIYKLNYPNNGFIDGSVNENRPIYEEFFQNAKLSNLSTLIITIDGSVREEDYLVLSLAQKYCIPTVIARTKLDEWLDNRPKDQSKEDYVKDDKKFVIESLQKLGINFSQNNIFNISALSTIIIAEEGSQSDMLIWRWKIDNYGWAFEFAFIAK
uniref:IRG-type G domain-containing protein n=1 Tax=Panagrolaimus sp. PS1159 TaxID=55785 RepID=A0AC35FVB9_9BILA